MTINIDADGTIFTHDYPLIGKDIGAVPILKKLTDNGPWGFSVWNYNIWIFNARWWFNSVIDILGNFSLYGIIYSFYYTN